MPSDYISEKIKELFDNFSNPLVEELLELGTIVNIENNAYVLLEGETCTNIPLIVEGTLKVIKEDESGKEFVLYRVKPGESCIMSITSNILDKPSEASVVSETPVSVLMIPLKASEVLGNTFPEWQKFVFQSVNDRYFGLIQKAANITFKSLSERLLEFIKEQSKDGELVITHENLAQELGSVREVVSRLLKNHEKLGNLELHRGRIKLCI